jgi:hypothetical protein
MEEAMSSLLTPICGAATGNPRLPVSVHRSSATNGYATMAEAMSNTASAIIIDPYRP